MTEQGSLAGQPGPIHFPPNNTSLSQGLAAGEEPGKSTAFKLVALPILLDFFLCSKKEGC